MLAIRGEERAGSWRGSRGEGGRRPESQERGRWTERREGPSRGRKPEEGELAGWGLPAPAEVWA